MLQWLRCFRINFFGNSVPLRNLARIYVEIDRIVISLYAPEIMQQVETALDRERTAGIWQGVLASDDRSLYLVGWIMNVASIPVA